jgi:hypothetical protein
MNFSWQKKRMSLVFDGWRPERKITSESTNGRRLNYVLSKVITSSIPSFFVESHCYHPVTSQLFAQSVPTSADSDRLPVSVDGVIADVHVTAFLSAIDDLLNSGRSPAPTAVLASTKLVINAVHNITEDIRQSSSQTAQSADVAAMISRADATVENLVAAARMHATSAGMSPVSLLDAAASHVSAVMTELGKNVLIRRARPGETTAVGSVSFDPALDIVAESPIRANGGRPISEPGSSNASTSPPPLFDRAAAPPSDTTTTAEGEDAWTELKVSSEHPGRLISSLTLSRSHTSKPRPKLSCLPFRRSCRVCAMRPPRHPHLGRTSHESLPSSLPLSLSARTASRPVQLHAAINYYLICPSMRTA